MGRHLIMVVVDTEGEYSESLERKLQDIVESALLGEYVGDNRPVTPVVGIRELGATQAWVKSPSQSSELDLGGE